MSVFFNQHWVVVGCSRRLGLYITTKLLAKGATVTGLYRELSESLVELKNSHPQKLSLLSVDLTKLDSSLSELSAHFQTQTKISGVIHLASQFFPTPLTSLTSKEWDVLFDTNVKGHVFLTQLFVSFLKRPSSITFLVDIYATKPLRNYLAYAAAKGALLTTMRNLALELAPHTRVNAISPGSVLLPENFSEEDIHKHQENTLLKRLGDPEDIWNAFYFLSHNQYITGVNLKVDGGTSLC